MTDRSFPQLMGIKEGDILAGKYRVERVLGIGGMGVVVAAHHIHLDERVALKFLLPEALGDADAVARFAREARAAAKIKSEYVARVTDVGTLPGGVPYMVMEYLEGGDLAGWIRQRGPLPIEQAVEFVLQACVAVADAHALGIVHRDLKPANLFCVRRNDGQLFVKVLDFGISKLTDRAGGASSTMTAQGMAFTKTAALMGSPLYMSPEQMRSARAVDTRTDIWALGVILFELLAGRAPFLAETVTDLAIKIATEPTPSIRGLRPDVPGGLEAAIGRCLEKEARDRYGSVADLALALRRFAPKRAAALIERISAIGRGSGPAMTAQSVLPAPQAPSAEGPAETLPPIGRTTRGSTGRTKAVAGAGVVGVAGLLAVAALGLLRRPPRPEESRNPGNEASSVGAGTPPQAASIDASAAAEVVRVADTSGVPTLDTPPAPAIPEAGTSAKATHPPSSQAAPSPTVAQPPKAASRPVTCTPPFYFDTRGNRVFKPECL